MNNIREKIQDRGLKNVWIANQLGVKACDISNWASGERKPNQERLLKLAKICGCKLRDLYPEIKRKTIYIY